MRVFFGWCRQRVWVALLLGLWAAVFAVVLFLYGSPVEAVGYALLLCLAALVLWASVDLLFYIRRTRTLQAMAGQAELTLSSLPDPAGPLEAAYQALVLELEEKRRQAVSDADGKQREAMDYYTLWAHQIKTPIAAMGLLLQGDETDRGRELASELFRVEQYTDLALSYLRLGSDATDYVIRSCSLMKILRQAARRYAGLFIRSRVSLDLRETDLTVLTDEKWLHLVVEQVLSNAVKYAPGGRVTVYTRGQNLVIADDGVGISREDLPRVFDKSFTGGNGRLEGRSTGIGLYLCREICRRLGHTITIDSEPGRGTRVTIGLARPYLEVE